MANTYELERDLRPILSGKVPLPNIKPVDKDIGAAILYYREMHCGEAQAPDTDGKIWNARFFLDYGQGGQLYGSGLVAWTAWDDGYRAKAVTFAICRHAFKSDPGANPMRGWHPGRCTKCGLDMTVDSGD